MTDSSRDQEINTTHEAGTETGARVDAHSASLIDALARRIQAEGSDAEFGAADEAGDSASAEPEGPGFAALGLSAPLLRSLSDSGYTQPTTCLLYTSPSPRDKRQSRMPSSA